MIVKVYIFDLQSKDGGEKPLEMAVPDRSKVGDVLAQFDLLGKKDIIAMVNDKRRQPDYHLKDGDVVNIYPVVAGG